MEPMLNADDVVELLWHLDGHLGLAIYRGEGSDQRWKEEASELRRRILKAIKGLQNDGSEGAAALGATPTQRFSRAPSDPTHSDGGEHA